MEAISNIRPSNRHAAGERVVDRRECDVTAVWRLQLPVPHRRTGPGVTALVLRAVTRTSSKSVRSIRSNDRACVSYASPRMAGCRYRVAPRLRRGARRRFEQTSSFGLSDSHGRDPEKGEHEQGSSGR